MAPTTIARIPSDHYSSRGTAAILALVVHSTAGTDSRAWLKRNPQGVSIHRLIQKNGTIIEMVPDGFAAHHVGGSRIVLNGRAYDASTHPNTNQITLGLELENRNDGRDPYPQAQLDAAKWQIADWRRRFGPLPVLYHRQIDLHGKTDPAGLPLGVFDYAAPHDPTAPLPSTPAPRYRGRWRLIATSWIRSAPNTKGRHIATYRKGAVIEGELRMGEVREGNEDWVAFEHKGQPAFIWSGQTERIA